MSNQKKEKQERAWELLDAIGEADERFIADTNKVGKPKKHRRNFWTYGAIAACLVLALVVPVTAVLLRGSSGDTVSVGSDGSDSHVLETDTTNSETETSKPSNGTSSDGSTDHTPSGETSGDENSDPNHTSEPSNRPDDPPTPPPVFASAPNLMEGIIPAKVPAQKADDAFLKEQMRFSLALLQQAAKGEKAEGNSLLLSPLSAQFALSMTANGARGQTRQEMLSLLAGNLSMQKLNEYLHTLGERLSETGDGYKVKIGNAIWYNKGLQVYKEFLQTNADYYGAGAFQTPFDEEARRAINKWVSDQTDGLLPEALKEIDPNAAMYLLNTILFDAEWRSIYCENDVRDDIFTAYDGKKQTVSFMYSREGTYYKDDMATGFAKPYKGGKYAFVALLPNKGVDVYDYVAKLTPEGLLRTLQNGKRVDVTTFLPKFSFEYEAKLEELLPALGMESAFESGIADFSGMMTGFDGRGHLEQVNQKTVISVGELGTKAAVVTTVQAEPDDAPEYSVDLNRPFVYLIVDTETNLPLFMGVQTEIGGDVPEGDAPVIEGDGEPEPPSYEGKDYTGLTLRIDDTPTADTRSIYIHIQNDSKTLYEFVYGDILLQKKTGASWETVPPLYPSSLRWSVPAGESFEYVLFLKDTYGGVKAGETYRVVFPGVEGLVCEFTVA